VARRVLVTGGSGFVGRHLLALLAPEGASILAWGGPGPDGTPFVEPADTPGVTWLQVDVLDARGVEAAVASAPPDFVYHLAGAAQVGGSWDRAGETLAVNLAGTHHLLEALRRHAPAARVLVSGSALVYRPADRALREDDPVGPVSPYGLSKLAQEMLALRAWQDDGQPVVVTRSFNHLGPGQTPAFFAPSVARQVAAVEAGRQPPVIEVGNLEARRDLMDVRDTVRAYRALMTDGRPGRIYNVCAGRAYRVGDLLEGLVARAGTPITVRVDPARLRPNDAPLVLGDASRIRTEVGWTAEVPIERTLDDLLDDWRRRLRDEP
jgi:GDP-4-dehydro-6-deoxy-D-mannose reductase